MPSLSPYRMLSDIQVEHFLTHGYVRVQGCFSPGDVKEWLDLAYCRLGYDPTDPSTWIAAWLHIPETRRIALETFAPRAWQAVDDLVGGVERIQNTPTCNDGFVINFKLGADRRWEPPSPHVPDWHLDNAAFKQFLDSPENGLVMMPLYTDVLPRSGGTFLALDSLRHVARHLFASPEGVMPHDPRLVRLISHSETFAEATGEAGDVYFLHPFLLHARSQNPSGRPRFIGVERIRLKEPMRFNRKPSETYSLVERSVLRALGRDQLDFSPRGIREQVVPGFRVQRQKMLEEHQARLASYKGKRERSNRNP